jgi:hypothetical protein
MHARVVRFSGVTDETIAAVVAQVEESGGPPPGVNATGMQLLRDPAQGTAIFIGYFADEADLRAADEVFEAMQPGETPGTRESVDRCEVVLERQA